MTLGTKEYDVFKMCKSKTNLFLTLFMMKRLLKKSLMRLKQIGPQFIKIVENLV